MIDLFDEITKQTKRNRNKNLEKRLDNELTKSDYIRLNRNMPTSLDVKIICYKCKGKMNRAYIYKSYLLFSDLFYCGWLCENCNNYIDRDKVYTLFGTYYKEEYDAIIDDEVLTFISDFKPKTYYKPKKIEYKIIDI